MRTEQAAGFVRLDAAEAEEHLELDLCDSALDEVGVIPVNRMASRTPSPNERPTTLENRFGMVGS
ncbi:hypothetical protein [Lentzea flaviverrucosa]|uniref:hypothetical protein n=1 Tax=Lentzea flaviverrucosa TaxID=200379 RepID=UPI001160639B|nr:hypothetical protein [Lentzea flaviverrucosa]